MKYLVEDSVIEEMERAVCRLESMGTILSSLCEPDRDSPDITSLADLGSLISRQALDVLNLLAEKEKAQAAASFTGTPKTVLDRDLGRGAERPCAAAKAADYGLTRIWFVPEIPND